MDQKKRRGEPRGWTKIRVSSGQKHDLRFRAWIVNECGLAQCVAPALSKSRRPVSMSLFIDACVAATLDQLIENADSEHKVKLLELRSRVAKRLA